MKYKTIQNVQTLRETEAFLEASIDLLAQARREVRIRSALLSGAVFDSVEFNQALSDFVRSSRDANVRILVDYPNVLLQRDHRTVALMRRLSDKIHFHHFYGEADEQRDSALLTDQQGLLIMPADAEAAGFFSLSDKIQTADLVEKFDYDWRLSPIASQLRQLSI